MKAWKAAPAGSCASLMSTIRSRRSAMPQKPSCTAKPESAAGLARCSAASTGSLRAASRALVRPWLDVDIGEELGRLPENDDAVADTDRLFQLMCDQNRG